MLQLFNRASKDCIMQIINQKNRLVNKTSPKNLRQGGFSLIELMVGLVIGLLVTLVIMQMFAAFEGQKRSTSSTADAQTSGSVALYNLQRDVQLAGFGLPLFDEDNMPLNCIPMPTVNHDDNGATPLISLAPIDIVDGGAAAGASDTVTVRYGNSASGGVAVPVINRTGAAVDVDFNMDCDQDDVVIGINGNVCVSTTVVATPASNTQINLRNPFTGVNIGDSISCMGGWNEFQFQVVANQLTRLNTFNNTVRTPVVDGIVNIQAQYGISAAPDNNRITRWVNATGVWAAGAIGNSAVCTATLSNRTCIKAVRVAIVARNGLLENLPAVSAACSSITIANPVGVCAWDATSANPVVASPAPLIDLSNTANWNQYRYKVYETIIPLRNIVWTRERL